MMRAIEDTLRDQDAVPRQFSSHRAIEASLANVLKPFRDDPVLGKFITALTRGAIAAEKRVASVASVPAPSGGAASAPAPPAALKTTKKKMQLERPPDALETSVLQNDMELAPMEDCSAGEGTCQAPATPRTTFLTILAERMSAHGRRLPDHSRNILTSIHTKVARDGSDNDRRVGEVLVRALVDAPLATKIVPALLPATRPVYAAGIERGMPSKHVDYLHANCGKCQWYRVHGPVNSNNELFSSVPAMFELSIAHVLDLISSSSEDLQQLWGDYTAIGVLDGYWRYTP